MGEFYFSEVQKSGLVGKMMYAEAFLNYGLYSSYVWMSIRQGTAL